MYYCENCERVFSGDELKTTHKCFETEYGVDHLFPTQNYYIEYSCPMCDGEIEDAMRCEICGEWFAEEELTDTEEYINGGCGYCCDGCIEDSDMRPI